MRPSWYLLRIDPAKRPDPEPERDPVIETAEDAEHKSAKDQVAEEQVAELKIPQVGTPLCHFVGLKDGLDEKDKQNFLWDKIQDGVRPAWAPDFLRMGYAVVFKRESLPKLALKLGIKNPMNVTKQERKRSWNRVLTFDDVWVMGCVPHMNPMFCPDPKLDPEDWWLATKTPGSVISPYLAPQGVTVAVGIQRLADVVIEILRQPTNYPRTNPKLSMEDDEDDDYSEFINPLVPLKPAYPADMQVSPKDTNYNSYSPQVGYGWAGIELYRYGQRY